MTNKFEVVLEIRLRTEISFTKDVTMAEVVNTAIDRLEPRIIKSFRMEGLDVISVSRKPV